MMSQRAPCSNMMQPMFRAGGFEALEGGGRGDRGRAESDREPDQQHEVS